MKRLHAPSASFPLIGGLLLTSVVLVAARPARAAVICVPNTGVDVSCTSSATSIGAAIAAANVLGGDTVLVAPGTYLESPIIDRPLALKASVPASEANAGNGAAQAIINGNGAVYTVSVSAGVNGVTIDGFEITNPTQAAPNTDASGIRVQIDDSLGSAVTVTIRNNVVHTIADPTRTSASLGESGISAFNIGTGSTISGNTIYGIADSQPSAGTVSPGSGRAQGILVKSSNGTASGITISGNTVHDVQDVAIRFNAVSVTPVCDITDNTIRTIGSPGTGFLSGIGIDHTGVGTIADNRVSGVVGGFGVGIQATGTTSVTANSVTHVAGGNGVTFPGAGILVNTNSVNVANNFLSVNAIGVAIGTTASGVTVNTNCIAGNTVGVANGSSATIDATNNWWGAPSGPSGVGPGTGDPIVNTGTGTTTFSPFSTTPNCAYVCSQQRFVDDSGSDVANDCVNASAPCQTIQRAIDLACSGDTVNVGAGTYRENVTVTKVLTVAGAGQGLAIVQPAVSDPNCGGAGGASLCPGASNIMLVRADNVTIHGLTLDGDNPTLTSGVVVGGADLDARNGIITDHNAGTFNGLEVHHVTVQNIYLRGIYASSGGTFNFHDNTVQNVQADPASIAIFNFGGAGTISRNVVTAAVIHLRFSNSTCAMTGSKAFN